MAQSFVKKARYYTDLPVWVVEDHNDALPHIYRAIASRHLPFQGITMLHFDSHPDLQIATELEADLIFDKDELFSCLSIENWILPAVYAGHINHVVWIRPPWSDQLPEGSTRVAVGRHKTSKKLRISWPDGYFLSDLLYAPTEDLECAKELTVDVVTMETNLVHSNNKTSCITEPVRNLSQVSTAENVKVQNDSQTQICQTNLVENQSATCPNLNQNTTGQNLSCRHVHTASDCPKQGLSKEISEQCENIERTTFKRTAYDTTIDEVSICENVRCDKQKGSTEDQHSSISGEFRTLHDVAVSAIKDSKGVVLDIDLDFFSTRNPFKEIYSESLFHQLEDLYSFQGPIDDTAQSLMQCTQTRAEQLTQLETALRLAIDGKDNTGSVAEKRFQKVKTFVDSLRATALSDEPLDAEMVHMAGLTCDDSGELPHHVSTQEEIDSLVVAMETMLSRLPRPVMVTVARSSHDDYCPPEQVDQIQDNVLKMLQCVYGQLDVHLDYNSQKKMPDT